MPTLIVTTLSCSLYTTFALENLVTVLSKGSGLEEGVASDLANNVEDYFKSQPQGYSTTEHLLHWITGEYCSKPPLKTPRLLLRPAVDLHQ